VTTIEDVLHRLRIEFLEMPGLRLKPEQVQRLCSVEWAVGQIILDMLVDPEFLCARPDGHYSLLPLPDGMAQCPQPAKADLIREHRVVRAS
jgi:hypothetical protein